MKLVLANIAFEKTCEQGARCAELLRKREKKVVFAESCTAGLISATLAQNPGISDFLCGSAVTYREKTKVHWLNIDESIIVEKSAVSSEVTTAMADRVLEKTPEASCSLAITGHLEPDATEQGPIVFVSTAIRIEQSIDVGPAVSFELTAQDRVSRQWEAVRFALGELISLLTKELN